MKNKILFVVGCITLAIIIGAFVMGQPRPAGVTSSTQDITSGGSIDLSASYITQTIKGTPQKMLAYNGSIPGPTIRVAQGSRITVHFKNNTDMPQLLHAHGVRMENAFDGSQAVQKEVPPGGSFDYELTFPDAGIYWYHPHANEVYSQGLGLYGAFIVTPTDPNYLPPVNREIPLFLSDLPTDIQEKITLKKDTPSHTLMGHYGNVFLINGTTDYNLTAQPGEVLRLLVVNASNARPYRFEIAGLSLKRVGGDSGAYEQATRVDSVVLGPSERVMVDVFLPRAGTYTLQNKTPETTYSLGTITVAGESLSPTFEKEFNILQSNVATRTSIDPFRNFFTKTPDKNITLTLDMAGNMMNMQGMGHGAHMMPDGTMMGGSMMQTSPDGIEWNDENSMMNEMSSPDAIKWKIRDTDTGKENMDIQWNFKKDQPVKIRIVNDAKSMHPMQHPMHFHGQRFLVVARNGVPQTNLVWKDTTLIASGETVDIILDPSNLGTWMAHCHISEHLEGGMMLGFKVEE